MFLFDVSLRQFEPSSKMSVCISVKAKTLNFQKTTERKLLHVSPAVHNLLRFLGGEVSDVIVIPKGRKEK